MSLQRPTQRSDRERLLTGIGLTVIAGYGVLAVANLLLVITGGH